MYLRIKSFYIFLHVWVLNSRDGQVRSTYPESEGLVAYLLLLLSPGRSFFPLPLHLGGQSHLLALLLLTLMITPGGRDEDVGSWCRAGS